MCAFKKSVFISYSHRDKDLLDGLKRHFVAIKDKVQFWDDSKIAAGMNWENEIADALSNAQVAVLLISADFFNSTYIMDREVPFLIKAQKFGLVILIVILKPCLIQLYPELSKFQFINSPERTIIQMSEAERETIWTKLILRINEIVEP